jgi:hypothetical protein
MVKVFMQVRLKTAKELGTIYSDLRMEIISSIEELLRVFDNERITVTTDGSTYELTECGLEDVSHGGADKGSVKPYEEVSTENLLDFLKRIETIVSLK